LRRRPLHAASGEVAAVAAIETAGELSACLTEALLDTWGKQLYRQALRLLVAVGSAPGSHRRACPNEQAWIWAARAAQQRPEPLDDIDRVAIMLIAGVATPPGSTVER